MPVPDLAACERIVRAVPVGTHSGRLSQVTGLLVEARGLNCALGELCRIEMPDGSAVEAEVVGFRGQASRLMPLGEAHGLRPGARVVPLGRRLQVCCGGFLLGRVLDGLGRPVDGGPELPPGLEMPLQRGAPAPMDRVTIDTPLSTGVSVIDGFLTLGRGQRIGIFAGSGVGKSTLLADVAREALSDVNVIALIGERGREVKEFLEKTLGEEGRRRSVVIVATSDAPALQRLKAAYTAVSIAEYFRDQGQDVMLMADSVTRIAAATREIGLALGEPPTVKGYPPSFFSIMPRLVERLGRTRRGSITGIFTVLVDGDDLNDPVADTLRGLLDGHVVLSRQIAHRGLFPAVDVLASVSRIMPDVVDEDHLRAARELRSLMAAYEESRDLVAVGAYKTGSDPKLDLALSGRDALEALIGQTSGAGREFGKTRERLLALRPERER